MRLLLALTVTLVAMALHVNGNSINIKKLKAILVALEKAGGSDSPEAAYMQGFSPIGPAGERGPIVPFPQGPDESGGPSGPQVVPQGETDTEASSAALDPVPPAGGSDSPEAAYMQGFSPIGPAGERGPFVPFPQGPDESGGPSGPQIVPQGETDTEASSAAVGPGPMEELRSRGSFLKVKCGIDMAAQLKAATPVAVTEVKAALTAAKMHVQGVVTKMEGHSTKLVEVGALLSAADSTIPAVIQAHSELLDQFNSTLTSTKDEAMCVFGHLVALRIHMDVFGSTGFTESSPCHTTVSTLHTFIKANNYDLEAAKSKMDVSFVKELGTAVVSDIKCLTTDLREFVDLLSDAEQTPATATARHVALMLEGLVSYASENHMLVEVVRGMVKMIPDVLNQQTSAAYKNLLHHIGKANSQTDLGKLMDVLKLAMELKQRR